MILSIHHVYLLKIMYTCCAANTIQTGRIQASAHIDILLILFIMNRIYKRHRSLNPPASNAQPTTTNNLLTNSTFNKEEFLLDLRGTSQTTDGNPLAYYFDTKEKKGIIKRMIDSYFEPGPNPEKVSLFQPSPYIKPRQKRTAKLIKFGNPLPCTEKCNDKQRNPQVVSRSSRQMDNSKKLGSDSLKLREMSKTTGIKSINQRQDLEDSAALLPIIAEISEDLLQHRRPQSEQKSRYLQKQSLERRQSVAFSPVKQSYVDNKSVFESNKSTFSNRSQSNQLDDQGYQNIDSTDLAESFVFSQSPTLISKRSNISGISGISRASRTSQGSRTSNRSFLKESKYYTIKYSKHAVEKQFKNEGLFLLNYEIKLKKFGALTLWENPPSENLFLTPHTPLSLELYSTTQHMHGRTQVTHILPNSEKYANLFNGNCEGLKDIIISLCRQFVDLQGKIIINHLTIRNITRLGERQVRVIDWSSAGLKEQVRSIDGNCVVKINYPILREKTTGDNGEILGQWLCQPEYLSPELIQDLEKGTQKNEKLWKNSSSSDMWCLGLLIFEILTLIPLQSGNTHYIKERSHHRKGILHMSQLSYSQLLRKQRLLCSQASRIVKKECQKVLLELLDPHILQVMSQMLTWNEQARITPQEVIRILTT